MMDKKRSIKSYVLRQGRMTAKQRYGLDQLWGEYGVDLPSGQRLKTQMLFPSAQPLVLEIGFGMGESLLRAAQNDPDRNYLGIEVHRPGVGSLLNEISEAGISNLKVICHDAVEVLSDYLPDGVIAECWILFPDPWHKKKHHKRRLVTTEFLTLVAKKICNQGVLHIATDWEEYAHWCMDLLKKHESFINTEAGDEFSCFNEFRGSTKFERRGLRLGHGIWDIRFVCNKEC